MCAYGMFFDEFNDKFPWKAGIPYPIEPMLPVFPYPGPTKEQFAELIKLLKAAQIRYMQPDCEIEFKKKLARELVRELADKLGVTVELP